MYDIWEIAFYSPQPKNDNNLSPVRNLNRDFCRARVHSAIGNTVNNVCLLPVYYMQMNWGTGV